MKVVLQRVKRASVSIQNKKICEMGPGIVLLLGIRKDDALADIEYIANKSINLRIFNDADGQMNKSLLEAFEYPQCMVVSNFTLYGDCRKGRRPSFVKAAGAEEANDIYNRFISEIKKLDVEILSGKFGAQMDIDLVNDGPVTLVFNSDHLKDGE